MSRRLALLACVAAAGAAPDNADVAAYVRGLGAVVKANDTRGVVREQVESMGAEFAEVPYIFIGL